MNWKHLLWIIPITVFITVFLVHPNMWNKPTVYAPMENESVKCMGFQETWLGINLYNCTNGKEYLEQVFVKEVVWENYTWSDKFYCGKYLTKFNTVKSPFQYIF